MIYKEKQLLLKDLCTRFPYGIICLISNRSASITEELKIGGLEAFEVGSLEVKPYLRPMSSMTEKERKEHDFYCGYKPYDENIGESYLTEYDMPDYMDWLLEHHLDYRGLIPMGLAIEAPEDMYKIK